MPLGLFSFLKGGTFLALRLLCPNKFVNSLAEINLPLLQAQGVKALIVDIDNTLVAWDKAEIESANRAWIEKAKQLGFSLCIVSNGKEKRVQGLARELGIPGLANAIKPRKRGFLRALELMNVRPEETAIVGDQLFTDILGGNRSGVYTIWVTPLSDQELPTTKLMRKLERRVARNLVKKGWLVTGSNRSEVQG